MARSMFGKKELIWSQNPGCFERHLQRKYRNALFPSDSRVVTQDQIDRARARDSVDAEDVRHRFTSLLRGLAEGGAASGGEALDRREALGDLLSRAAEVGDALKDDMPAIFQMYEAVVRDILASLSDSPELARELRTALAFSIEKRRLFNNCFVAQLRRRDTPIHPDEVVPSLLSETPETIRLMTEVLSDQPDLLAGLQERAFELIASSTEARDILVRQPEKLAALGLDTDSAN